MCCTNPILQLSNFVTGKFVAPGQSKQARARARARVSHTKPECSPVSRPSQTRKIKGLKKTKGEGESAEAPESEAPAKKRRMAAE